MISADTSTWIDFFKDVPSEKVDKLVTSLRDNVVMMTSPVLMELLSFQGVGSLDQDLLRALPRVDLKEGYWERAADTRKGILKKRLKARAMDCLIAQCCLDDEIALIANDNDFRYFVEAGLKLISHIRR